MRCQHLAAHGIDLCWGVAVCAAVLSWGPAGSVVVWFALDNSQLSAYSGFDRSCT
jgi:hypothetical protein